MNGSDTNCQTICAAQNTPKTRGCRPCFLLHALWPGPEIVACRLHPIRHVSWLLVRKSRRLRENHGHRCFLERARPFTIGTMETSASGFSNRHKISRWQSASLRSDRDRTGLLDKPDLGTKNCDLGSYGPAAISRLLFTSERSGNAIGDQEHVGRETFA